MFDAFYCSRVVRRLEANANAKLLKAYLVELGHRGHARNTIQVYGREAELFVNWLRRRKQPLSAVDEATVRQFACRHRSRHKPRLNTRAALRHLLRYLRAAGLAAAQPKAGRRVFLRVIAEYDDHLQSTCGLAEATRLYRRRYAREFLEFVFPGQRVRWRRIAPQHVQSYIATFAKDGRIAAARVAAASLRSFFRWLQLRGLISSNLIGAVPGFRIWRWGSLPTVMTEDQLRHFLAVFDQSRPSGCRDYAMALCMVVLGLRVAEVADLTLADLDTTAGTLRLSAGKPRRDRVLPMPSQLQRAVLKYVRRIRPKTTDPHLFVRHRTPVGVAVTRELVRGAMRRAYAIVEGCQNWTGTHVLRHTAATRLHRVGADLKRVADILGHASIDTTAIYAKVDMNRLRQVALPWPGAKEVQP